MSFIDILGDIHHCGLTSLPNTPFHTMTVLRTRSDTDYYTQEQHSGIDILDDLSFCAWHAMVLIRNGLYKWIYKYFTIQKMFFALGRIMKRRTSQTSLSNE